jgi:RecA/RadA recombinase
MGLRFTCTSICAIAIWGPSADRRIRFATPTSSAIRLQIESALAQKIPSALTPAPKIVRPVAATGIASLDEVLKGGLPVGAVSELVGPECSGRTSVALSFLSRMTQAAKVCALN